MSVRELRQLIRAGFKVRPDRRSGRRFDLALPFRYAEEGGDFSGSGELLNIGSGGLCFRSDGRHLRVGQSISLKVEWRALLEDRHRLHLAIDGHVVRKSRGIVAVQIASYEFQLAGTKGGDSP